MHDSAARTVPATMSPCPDRRRRRRPDAQGSHGTSTASFTARTLKGPHERQRFGDVRDSIYKLSAVDHHGRVANDAVLGYANKPLGRFARVRHLRASISPRRRSASARASSGRRQIDGQRGFERREPSRR